MKYKIANIVFKHVSIFLILLLSFFFLNINLTDGINLFPFDVIIFTIVTEVLIFYSFSKLFFIIISNICFFVMAIFFILNIVEIANIFGIFGFGILIITTIFYLPQLFKNGHIV